MGALRIIGQWIGSLTRNGSCASICGSRCGGRSRTFSSDICQSRRYRICYIIYDHILLNRDAVPVSIIKGPLDYVRSLSSVGKRIRSRSSNGSHTGVRSRRSCRSSGTFSRYIRQSRPYRVGYIVYDHILLNRDAVPVSIIKGPLDYVSALSIISQWIGSLTRNGSHTGVRSRRCSGRS